MVKVFVVLFSLFSITHGLAQLNATFYVNSKPDELRSLELKKDGTYSYTRLDLFSDHLSIIESGTYQIKKKQITFQSLTKSDDMFGGQHYYLGKLSKRRLTAFTIHTTRKTMRPRVLILHKGFR